MTRKRRQGPRPPRQQHLRAVPGPVPRTGDPDHPSISEIVLESLDRSVGGRLQLMALDVEPLPDEPFEWAGVPEDIRPVVQQVLDA
jgi:hypothetical protein